MMNGKPPSPDAEGVPVRGTPSDHYGDLSNHPGAEGLTPALALLAELVRRFGVVSPAVSVLEVQKLAWFLERAVENLGISSPMGCRFEAGRYGPCAEGVRHLLNALDGSYLHCERRLADAGPTDAIWFESTQRERLARYLAKEEKARRYVEALEEADSLIDGFQSPHALELLATVDWLLAREGCEPTVPSILEGLRIWPGEDAGQRKLRIFSESQIRLALEQLSSAAAAGSPRK